jgi:hypothetical protein
VKLIDANILLYAYDSSSAHHSTCRDWLQAALNKDEPIGLPEQTDLAFLRIATNPRAVRRPISTEEACDIITALIGRPGVVVVEPVSKSLIPQPTTQAPPRQNVCHGVAAS